MTAIKRYSKQNAGSELAQTPQQILDGIVDPELKALAQQAFKDLSHNLFETVSAHLKKPGAKPVEYFGDVCERYVGVILTIDGEEKTFVDLYDHKNDCFGLSISSRKEKCYSPFEIKVLEGTAPPYPRLSYINGHKKYSYYVRGECSQQAFELSLAQELKAYCENDETTHARINLNLLNRVNAKLLSLLQHNGLKASEGLAAGLLEAVNP